MNYISSGTDTVLVTNRVTDVQVELSSGHLEPGWETTHARQRRLRCVENRVDVATRRFAVGPRAGRASSRCAIVVVTLDGRACLGLRCVRLLTIMCADHAGCEEGEDAERDACDSEQGFEDGHWYHSGTDTRASAPRPASSAVDEGGVSACV